MQYLGTTYLYSNGTYSWDTLHQNAFENFKQFGPIVREDLLPGVTIVHLFNHQDIKTLFHSEVSAVKQQLWLQFIIIFLTIKIIAETFCAITSKMKIINPTLHGLQNVRVYTEGGRAFWGQLVV